MSRKFLSSCHFSQSPFSLARNKLVDSISTRMFSTTYCNPNKGPYSWTSCQDEVNGILGTEFVEIFYRQEIILPKFNKNHPWKMMGLEEDPTSFWVLLSLFRFELLNCWGIGLSHDFSSVEFSMVFVDKAPGCFFCVEKIIEKNQVTVFFCVLWWWNSRL